MTLLLSLFLIASASAAGAETLSASIEAADSLPDAQRLAWCDGALDEIRDALGDADALKAHAEADGDDERVGHVVSRRASIDALLTVAEAARGDLEVALGEGDRERAQLQHREIADARVEALQLLAEAEAERPSSGRDLPVDPRPALEDLEIRIPAMGGDLWFHGDR